MTLFDKGMKMKLDCGDEASVVRLIRNDRHCDVYEVILNDEIRILKYYSDLSFSDTSAFYDFIAAKLKDGPPSERFYWPGALTEKTNEGFGYVTGCVPKSYHDLDEFLLLKADFSSYAKRLNAAIEIVRAFECLHEKGYFFQSADSNVFLVDGNTGDVVIDDCEYITSVCAGARGSIKFEAPEVIAGKCKSDMHSDLFLLSELLFVILFSAHPFEGRRLDCHAYITRDAKQEFYAKSPIFAFDPNDESNRPVSGVSGYEIQLWKKIPKAIKEKFYQAFSRSSLGYGDLEEIRKNRVACEAWRHELVNLRSRLVKCPACGEDLFLDFDSQTICPNSKCGHVIGKNRILAFGNGEYRVPIFPGVGIYKCMVDSLSDDCETQIGSITVNPQNPNILGIKNESSKPWLAVSKKTIESGRILSFSAFDEVYFDQCEQKGFAKIID